MKKVIYGMWVKGIVMVICVISLLGNIGCIIGMVACSELPAEKEIRNYVFEQIAMNYSAYLLANLDDTEEIEAFFNESNMEAAIVASTDSDLSKVDLDDPSIYLYGEPELATGYNYVLEGEEGAVYYYNIDSVYGALAQNSFVHHYREHYEEITRYVFSPLTGLFYYKTASGYYPVSDVEIQWANGRMEYYTLDTELMQYFTAVGEALDVDSYLNSWSFVWLDGEMHHLHAYNCSQIKDGMKVFTIGDQFMVLFIMDTLTPVIENVNVRPDEGYLAVEDPNIMHYWVLSKVDLLHNADDLFYDTLVWLNWIYAFKQYAIGLQVVFSLLFLASFIFLLRAAGHRKADEEIHTRIWDRIPFGIYTAVIAGLEVLGIVGIFLMLEQVYEDTLFLIVLCIELAALLLFLLIAYCMSMAVRVKTKHFWKYTLLYHIFRLSRNVHKKIQSNATLFWKTILVLWGINLTEFLIAMVMFSLDIGDWDFVWYYDEALFVIIVVFIFKILESIGVIWIVFQMDRLQKGSQRIAEGDLSTPIDTAGLIWEFRKHAENINKIGDGIAIAVEKEMKSERFRTELITNVSHDIKTPLTSIINYVDLMKKEDIKDEVLLEYIDVLDRQSTRLKKMTDDLMEVSKASTGNLKVNLERCDTDVLLTQVLGEYEERMQSDHLDPIIRKIEQPVIIWADGRHIWRVFDNLFSNICKYALSGTRVYVNLEQNGTSAVITFRNISKYQLNISSDELMERFVRGDSSRNTEGSGLGLSIARSLTELMHGRMLLSVDGDLFKVTLYFPIYIEGAERVEIPEVMELPEVQEVPDMSGARYTWGTMTVPEKSGRSEVAVQAKTLGKSAISVTKKILKGLGKAIKTVCIKIKRGFTKVRNAIRWKNLKRLIPKISWEKPEDDKEEVQSAKSEEE